MASEEQSKRGEQSNELTTNISTLMTEFKMLHEEVQVMKEAQSGTAHSSFDATAGPKKGKAKRLRPHTGAKSLVLERGASKTCPLKRKSQPMQLTVDKFLTVKKSLFPGLSDIWVIPCQINAT